MRGNKGGRVGERTYIVNGTPVDLAAAVAAVGAVGAAAHDGEIAGHGKFSMIPWKT